MFLIVLCNNTVFAKKYFICPGDYEIIHIQVVKIDTLLDNYIIYAKADTLQLKIVTWKCSVCCNNISIGDSLLVSLLSDEYTCIKSKGGIYKRLRILCNHCVTIRGRDTIATGRIWEGELFYVKEIYGLCYTLNEETLQEYEQWLTKYFLPSLEEYYPPFRKKRKAQQKTLLFTC